MKTKIFNLIKRTAEIYAELEKDEYENKEDLYKALGTHNSLGKLNFYINLGDVEYLLDGTATEDSVYGDLQFKGEGVSLHNGELKFASSQEKPDWDTWLIKVGKYIDRYYPMIQDTDTPEIGEEKSEDKDITSARIEGRNEILELILKKLLSSKEITF